MSTAVELSSHKERMWERFFFKLCSSSKFEVLWKEFLIHCGTDSKPAVYQHITDKGHCVKTLCSKSAE